MGDLKLTCAVVLQPLPQDPPPHAKCKDKFLVQSAFIPADEEMRSLPEMVCVGRDLVELCDEGTSPGPVTRRWCTER